VDALERNPPIKVNTSLRLLPKERPNKKIVPVKDLPGNKSTNETKDETIIRLKEQVAKLEKKTKRMHTKLRQVKMKWLTSQNDSEAEFELRINRLLKRAGSPRTPCSQHRQELLADESMSIRSSLMDVGHSGGRTSFSSQQLSFRAPSRGSQEIYVENMTPVDARVSNIGRSLGDINTKKDDLELRLGTASTDYVQTLGTVIEKQESQDDNIKSLEAPTNTGSREAAKVHQKIEAVLNQKDGGGVQEEKQQFLKEVKAVYEQNQALSTLLSKFKTENFTLQQKIKRTTEEAILLREEKAQLERNLEISSENMFNRARKGGRDRANSIGSISSDSFSDSLSFVSTNPPSPSYQSAREKKVFIEESNKMFAQQRAEAEMLSL